MSQEEIDIELIERYLEQNLTAEEKADFDTRLETDRAFKDDFDKIKLLVEGIRLSGTRSSIKSKIEHLESTLPDIELVSSSGFLSNRWNVLKYAASILLILASAWLLRDWFFKPDHEAIFAANFEPYLNTGSGTVRGDNDNKSPEQMAYAAYDADNFQEAVNRFRLLLAQEEDAAMRLYLGNALLALGEVDSAKEQFNTLIANDVGLITQARWYLSLSHIKAGELDQAKALLVELSQNGESYRHKAQKILDEL